MHLMTCWGVKEKKIIYHPQYLKRNKKSICKKTSNCVQWGRQFVIWYQLNTLIYVMGKHFLTLNSLVENIERFVLKLTGKAIYYFYTVEYDGSVDVAVQYRYSYTLCCWCFAGSNKCIYNMVNDRFKKICTDLTSTYTRMCTYI